MLDTITISWSIEDVQSVDGDLTDDQARKVLSWLKKNHDATVGISWDVIGVTIGDMRSLGEL